MLWFSLFLFLFSSGGRLIGRVGLVWDRMGREGKG